ncbi:7599_t:CDS:2, partial [Gigaspora margarita]
INQKPDKRPLIRISKTLWIIREIDPNLEVLPLYAQFKAISLQDNKMSTAGYYYHQTSAGKDNWIPLLPGYSWYAYDDTNLESFKMQSEYSLFKSARSKYDPKHQKIVEVMQHEHSFQESLKRKAKKISNLIDINGKTGILDNYNILLEKEDKVLPATSYSYKTVIAFHVAQKSRLIKYNETEILRTVCKDNYKQFSRQIEHAILIEVLNQISPLLEDNGLYLEVYIDGDLDSNKTLVHVHIVSKISANLKQALH